MQNGTSHWTLVTARESLWERRRRDTEAAGETGSTGRERGAAKVDDRGAADGESRW